MSIYIHAYISVEIGLEGGLGWLGSWGGKFIENPVAKNHRRNNAFTAMCEHFWVLGVHRLAGKLRDWLRGWLGSWLETGRLVGRLAGKLAGWLEGWRHFVAGAATWLGDL